MPRKKIPCPSCGLPMAATSEQCRQCKPSYVRTPEHNASLSILLSGKPKPWLAGKKRPDVGQKIAAWWTQDRRQAKRIEVLSRNPDARYHGLSAKEAKDVYKRQDTPFPCAMTALVDYQKAIGFIALGVGA